MKSIKIRALPEVSSRKSALSLQEEQAYEEISSDTAEYVPLTKLQAEAIEAFHRASGLKQDNEERKKYARKSFCLISYWLFGVFLLLVFNALKISWFEFKLSDTVILAVIGGTTVNVLGIFVFVMKYLFELKRGS